MTILAASTISLIADRLRMENTVTLSALTAHEVLHRAASSFMMEIVLDQIAQGNGREAAWAKRTLDDMKRNQPKLKYPSQLKTIEVV